MMPVLILFAVIGFLFILACFMVGLVAILDKVL